MTIFRCKSCGASLEIDGKQSIVTCDYCDVTQTLPRLEDDRIANLYDRANHFRRSGDYAKAMETYQLILNENTSDAEAYWSIVLCRYGITYVEDPLTKKRIPTVNRAQFTSVLADEDYKSALAHADAIQRGVYEQEAKTIDGIQKNILRIVQNESPYDVFICYKDKDNQGQPTEDRRIAAEIYNRLTREGFKVFFAHYTLDEKLGHEYEPYIFAALQSAPVMIVLGTQSAYFNAVWVKNEWSRYLELIKDGAQKTLIAAYKNMDAYDLPTELSLQAQDMDKMGFIENLVYTVRREVERNAPKPAKPDTSVITIAGTNENANNYLKRAFMALEDGQWNDAKIYCEKILNLDPECGIAYAGKLLAELRLKNLDMLGGVSNSFEENPLYKRALQFADDSLRAILTTAVAQIKYRKASEWLEHQNFGQALPLFNEILDYKDASEKAKQCREQIAARKKQLQLAEEAQRLEEQKILEQARRLAEEKRIAEEKRKAELAKKRKIKRVIGMIVTVMLVASVLAGYLVGYPMASAWMGDYTTLINLYNLKEYTIADGVTKIDKQAFSHCESLTSIIIPDSVTEIGERAFEYCTNLKTVIIPEGVTKICDEAFYGCEKLTTVVIPHSVTDIEDHIFDNCKSLSKITVSRNYTTLGIYREFITEYILPEGTTVIETEAFRGHIGLTEYTIPDGVTIIDYGAFDECDNLTRVALPDSLTQIGYAAFYGCGKLTEINLPNGLTEIGELAFYKCGLTSITIPYGITEIKDSTFSECSRLTSVTIPDSVTKIGDGAFFFCSQMPSITIPVSVTEIGVMAFQGCNSLLDINYAGTMDQWNAISKGDNWGFTTSKYTIHCTDGDIAK